MNPSLSNVLVRFFFHLKKKYNQITNRISIQSLTSALITGEVVCYPIQPLLLGKEITICNFKFIAFSFSRFNNNNNGKNSRSPTLDTSHFMNCKSNTFRNQQMFLSHNKKLQIIASIYYIFNNISFIIVGTCSHKYILILKLFSKTESNDNL